jgi:hypothetical protein
MYPSGFEYVVPGTITGEAKVLAGGQSLIPLMKLRLASLGEEGVSDEQLRWRSPPSWSRRLAGGRPPAQRRR